MRAGAVALVILVLAAAGAAAWFALSGDPGTPGAPEAPDAPVADAPEKTAAERGAGRTRAAAASSWTRRGEGTVLGSVREHGAERPLGGVEVELSAGGDGPSQTLKATTGADGAFRFERVPDFGGWTFRAHVKSPAVEVEQAGVAVLPDRTTDLGVIYALVPRTLTGIVVDEAGAPVAGAEVRVLRTFRLDKIRAMSDMLSLFLDAPMPVDVAQSGADGRFRLTRTPPGAFDVAADRDGFARGTEHVSIVVGEEPQPVTITLGAGHAVLGKVVRKDGRRVDGIRVRASPADGEMSAMPWNAFARVVMATTELSGEFKLPGLSTGKWELTALSDGEMSSAQVEVAVPHEGRVEIPIGGESVLAGRVTGPAEEPVAEARIIAGLQGAGQQVATGLSRQDGSYELRGFEPGQKVQVMVEARGYAPAIDMMGAMRDREETAVEIVAGRNVHDVRLAAGGTLRGRVVEKGTQKGLEGVRVTLRSSDLMGIFGGVEAFTGADGAFEVKGLTPGSLRASLEKTGWHAVGDDGAAANPFAAMMMGREDHDDEAKTDTGAGLDVVAAEGIAIQRTLEMEHAAVVAGKVVGPDGVGIAGARVAVKAATAGPAGFDIMEILGAVTGADDDKARVTDAAGAFELTATPGQPFRVTAKADGFVEGKSAESTAEPGARVEGVVITLSRGALVEGLVTAPDGAPVADADVTWEAAASADDPMSMAMRMSGALGRGRKGTAAKTGADGRFRLSGVKPGKVSLTVRRKGFRAATKGVEVQDGVTQTADVALDRGVAVAGRVLDDTGHAVVSARVSCTPAVEKPDTPPWMADSPDDGSGGSLTEADGTFRVEGLAPGTYTVRAHAKGLFPSADVQAVAGGPAIDVRLVRGMAIAGIVRCDGRPAAGVKVRAARVREKKAGPDDDEAFGMEDLDSEDFDVEDAGGNGPVAIGVGIGGRTAISAADGSFEVKDLAPGSYTLTATSAGPDSASVLRTSSAAIATGTRSVVIECKAGLVLAGTVTLPDGSRAAKGTVEASAADDEDEVAEPAAEEEGASGEADSFDSTAQGAIRDGAFRIAGLKPGRYVLKVAVPGAAKAAVVADAGKADLAVRLTPPGSLAGRVLLPGAKPARDAWLRITPAAAKADGPWTGEFESTNNKGNFTAKDLAEGAWRISVTFDSGGRKWTGGAEVVVRAGQATTVPDIVLRDSGASDEIEADDE